MLMDPDTSVTSFKILGRVEVDTYIDKKVYDGDWNDGHMEGKGDFSWPDQSCYSGEYI